MTTTTASPSRVQAAATSRTDRLRTLLRVDAALCAATGLLAAAAPGAVADLLGPDVSTTVVRVVGIALVVWALDATLLARRSERVVVGTSVAAGVANLAWELGTVGLVVAGAFSVAGAVAALAVAAVVGGLGLLQLRAVRRS
jgi:hypothetical protein